MTVITIIGGHGKVALRRACVLTRQGHRVTAWIRNSDHREDVERTGATALLADIETLDEIWSAKVATRVRHADRFGTQAGAVTVDMAPARQRKHKMVDGLIAMHLDNYRPAAPSV